MKRNILLIGNLGDMKNHTLVHTMRWIRFVIMTLIPFKSLISLGMGITMLTTLVIMELEGLLGLRDAIVMIMLMMIMIVGPVCPIKAGRIAVIGTMTMVVIVMIPITIEVVGEMEIGGSVDPVIRDALVGNEIRVHIEGMSAPGLGGMMITLDQGPLEHEAIVELIARTATMMIDMRGWISEGSVKRSVIASNILWPHLPLLL